MKISQLAVGILFLATVLVAADWSQYRGPNHDGSTTEKILTDWPAEGPPVLWKATIGPSFGSFAVSSGKVFCFVQREVDGADKETAVALDAKTGKELWAAPLGKPTYDDQGGDGPRSTPTVDDDRVYILGAYQVLSCLNAADGKVIWQHDLSKEFGGRVIRWNSAASPALDGDLIFVNAGGAGQALLAFDKKTGKLAWKSENDLPTHSTPVPVTIHGVRQVIFFTQSGLVSVHPKTGGVLWRYAFPFNTSTGMSPVVWQDIVFCSAAYGVGGGAVRVTKNGAGLAATEIWWGKGVINHWSTPVCKDGYLYGLFGTRQLGTGPLECIEMATGKKIWSQPGFGCGGATILVDGNVLVQSDRGPLALVEATPKGYHELTRAQVIGGKCWTMPAVSNGKIIARNTKEAVCLDIAVKTAAK